MGQSFLNSASFKGETRSYVGDGVKYTSEDNPKILSFDKRPSLVIFPNSAGNWPSIILNIEGIQTRLGTSTDYFVHYFWDENNLCFYSTKGSINSSGTTYYYYVIY